MRHDYIKEEGAIQKQLRANMPKDRDSVPFDVEYFKKLNAKLTTEQVFTKIYDTAHWNGDSSVSGSGSNTVQTDEISKKIPLLIKNLNITSLLDLPCGDFNWMDKLNIPVNYIGGDIVKGLIEKNIKKYKSENREFLVLDIINDSLPSTDLILCRDCFVHLSNNDILKAVQNIKKSKCQYLLTTTFVECDTNEDIITGDWRVINLQKEPFNFPEPLLIINEKCSEGNGTYSDKSLGLWKIKDI